MSDKDEILRQLYIEHEALEVGHVSVHDALQAWQAGLIDDAGAMQLSGCESVADMLDACRSSDVEIRRK